MRQSFLFLAVITLCGRSARAQRHGVVVHDTIHSAALAANVVGDSPARELLVYPPPSYASHPERRYPVLYLIHGFTSAPKEWLDGSYDGLSLATAMDSLLGVVRDSLPEFIVVMPDGDNRFGGGFYIDSPVTGGWATYVVHDVAGDIDRRFRTLPTRTHRALAGLSMGGFGALTLGAEHPELFGLVYAMSPCCTSLAGEFAIASPAWRTLDTAQSTKLAENAWNAHLVRALAVALSPAPNAARRYGALPVAVAGDGTLQAQPGVVARWRARMPIGLIHNFARPGTPIPALYLEYGRNDAVASVIPGVIELAHALDSLGIHYTLRTFDGGHVDRLRQRLSEQLLPTVGHWLRAAH